MRTYDASGDSVKIVQHPLCSTFMMGALYRTLSLPFLNRVGYEKRQRENLGKEHGKIIISSRLNGGLTVRRQDSTKEHKYTVVL